VSVKFIRAHLGDVFRMPMDEERVGYGQLLAKSTQGDAFLAGAFETLYPADANPDLNAVVQDRILFAVRSICDMVIAQRWPVVGRVPPRGPIALPRYRVYVDGKGWCVEGLNANVRRASEGEIARLPLASYSSLQSLSTALQAYHGLGEPEDDVYEIEYETILALQDIKV